jgi:hypothetical protein
MVMVTHGANGDILDDYSRGEGKAQGSGGPGGPGVSDLKDHSARDLQSLGRKSDGNERSDFSFDLY